MVIKSKKKFRYRRNKRNIKSRCYNKYLQSGGKQGSFDDVKKTASDIKETAQKLKKTADQLQKTQKTIEKVQNVAEKAQKKGEVLAAKSQVVAQQAKAKGKELAAKSQVVAQQAKAKGKELAAKSQVVAQQAKAKGKKLGLQLFGKAKDMKSKLFSQKNKDKLTSAKRKALGNIDSMKKKIVSKKKDKSKKDESSEKVLTKTKLLKQGNKAITQLKSSVNTFKKSEKTKRAKKVLNQGIQKFGKTLQGLKESLPTSEIASMGKTDDSSRDDESTKKCKKQKCKQKISNRQLGSIFSELLLLKKNLYDILKMFKDLILKYYPDANMPEKNGILLLLISFAEFIQQIICDTTGSLQRMFCSSLNDETPKNIKELICFNTEIITKLKCDNIKNVIALFKQLLNIDLSGDVEEGEEGEEDEELDDTGVIGGMKCINL